ncbi:hypothetical protein Desaf_3787 [Desulfocurvibacter africanus subsp. africanus str. Walvis Bay]|uniref:Integrase catalytic region n=1 Tax=Desulfocurvibacter africanus subsp. africanus str. Walvis Bay TaxID=690850 RepID=F3Z034_DESAF|nr:hypothetical protein Desaf_3787 [Desulfocurvibacter africanus subsp. africanus str. Walvis Bay]
MRERWMEIQTLRKQDHGSRETIRQKGLSRFTVHKYLRMDECNLL